MSLMQLINVNVYIGNMHILRDISFDLEAGEVIGLVGPNGAGKTTTLKTIMGILPCKTGKIVLDGEDIAKLPANIRTRRGVGYSPEDRRLIPEFTVEENILLPCWVLGTPKKEIKNVLNYVYSFLPQLEQIRDRKGKHLSGGQQKMVSIARSIVHRPRVLLLDEPFEGLAPLMVRQLIESLEKIKSMGVSMIIAESSVANVRKIADALVKIERGKVMEMVRNA